MARFCSVSEKAFLIGPIMAKNNRRAVPAVIFLRQIQNGKKFGGRYRMKLETTLRNIPR